MNTFTRFCGNSEKVNRVNLRPANFLGSDSYGKPSQMLHDLVSGRSVATQKKTPQKTVKTLARCYGICTTLRRSRTSQIPTCRSIRATAVHSNPYHLPKSAVK